MITAPCVCVTNLFTRSLTERLLLLFVFVTRRPAQLLFSIRDSTSRTNWFIWNVCLHSGDLFISIRLWCI